MFPAPPVAPSVSRVASDSERAPARVRGEVWGPSGQSVNDLTERSPVN